MAVRYAVAIGQDFVPWGDVLSDAGVARDVISYLRAGAEPMVLWVTAAGGTKDERLLVAGDWLCDSDGSEPRRIRSPRWGYDAEAKSWSRSLTLLSAWESCPDARWLLNAVHSIGVDRRPLALAACACARIALPLLPGHETRPRRAVEATEAWARGKATLRRVRAAEEASVAAQRAMIALAAAPEPNLQAVLGRHAAQAAALASTYASSTATAPSADFASAALSAAANAVAEAAPYFGDAAEPTRRRIFREMVTTVRANIPTVAVLRAAAPAA